MSEGRADASCDGDAPRLPETWRAQALPRQSGALPPPQPGIRALAPHRLRDSLPRLLCSQERGRHRRDVATSDGRHAPPAMPSSEGFPPPAVTRHRALGETNPPPQEHPTGLAGARQGWNGKPYLVLKSLGGGEERSWERQPCSRLRTLALLKADLPAGHRTRV